MQEYDENTEQDVFDEETASDNQYLLFTIGEETYAIDIGQITEIIEMQGITEVPDMPHFVKGVINLRGRVVPVIDFRLRIGMEERSYDDRTCMIIVNTNGSALGYIVDTVAEVHNIPTTSIDTPPEFESGGAGYISGLGKIEDRVVIIVDAETIVEGLIATPTVTL